MTFTLYDVEHILDPETHPHLTDADNADTFTRKDHR